MGQRCASEGHNDHLANNPIDSQRYEESKFHRGLEVTPLCDQYLGSECSALANSHTVRPIRPTMSASPSSQSATLSEIPPEIGL